MDPNGSIAVPSNPLLDISRGTILGDDRGKDLIYRVLLQRWIGGKHLGLGFDGTGQNLESSLRSSKTTYYVEISSPHHSANA